MPKYFLKHATMIAAISVAAAIMLMFGLQSSGGKSVLSLIGLLVTLGVLGALVVGLVKSVGERETKSRQSLQMVERLQMMLGTSPSGYCLFTPQSVLREAMRMPPILGIEKVTHVEDIVGALKEAAEFLASFRKLQQIGEAFDLTLETLEGKRVQIAGRRFRTSRDGSLIDVLWFTALAPPAHVVESDANIMIKDQGSPRQRIMDAFSFPVWWRNTELELIGCNQAYATDVDSSVDAAVTKQSELVSQTARGGSGRALAANALASLKAQSERRHVIIAGKRRLLEITEQPLKNEAGEAKGLIGFAVDVTAEEDKENELQRHLTAQQEVLELLGSAIAIYGADTRLEFYNRAYMRLWDADENFLNSKPSFGEILEDLRTRRLAPEQTDFQRYKKERVALFTSLLEPREDLMHLPDGTTLRILAAPHPLGGIMFVHEDVTDKLALESSYNTLIAVQRETLDNLAEGIAVFGLDGKLRLYNPSFAAIWKLAGEFLNTNPHVAELLEHMKPLFHYGENWSSFKNEMVEYTLDRNLRKGRIERADQSVIEYSAVPLPDGAVLNSYLDISDSIKVEQALRASNAALATADRLKSEFVANVSYQLRTPLNTIMGFSEILTNQYFGTLNERQLDYTRTIMEASKRLLLLINDVLDLATIEAGRMTLNRAPLAVAELLNVTKQMTAEWARQQSLEIIIDCPSNIGSFDVDEARIKQVLFNLISNAIKYTPSGGRITLEARREDPWIIIAVVDTGVGIPDSDLERVFGKFERANPQVRQSGSGLGLSLVKSFVELHGGTIELDSAVGKGTRVTCKLPIAATGD